MKFFTKEEEKEEEPKVKLFLEEDELGDVLLKGIDKRGQERIIMRFMNGVFARASASNLEGLKTDEQERIKEFKH